MLCIRKSFILPALLFLALVYLLLTTLLPTTKANSANFNGAFEPASEVIVKENPADIPNAGVHWQKRPDSHPVGSYGSLPTGPTKPIPRIQHRFGTESWFRRRERVKRQKAVKKVFKRAWKSYKDHAWLQDELTPLTGSYKNEFSGWAATLVDSLDSLLIMDMDDEFQEAVKAIERIDFTTTKADEINVFETMIRYVGGFLGAYDLTGGKYPILLQKAVQLADMLYCAFDTPNRMPQSRWEWTR